MSLHRMGRLQAPRLVSVAVLIIILSVGNINCRQPGQNPYDVLEIPHSSNQQEVKQKFRELSKVYHPDKLKLQNLSEELLTQSQHKFKQIASAYEFIKYHHFNSRIIRTFYQNNQQSQAFQSHHSYDTFMDDLNSEMFMEFGDYRFDRARQEEKVRKREGNGLYVRFSLSKAMIMDFIRYMIRNKMMTLGAFFISLGLFALLSSVKPKAQITLNKSTNHINKQKPSTISTSKPGTGASDLGKGRK